jgi:hypothetical protein
MTSSKTIIDALLEEKLVSVKENTESVLNYKLANKLQEKYADIAPSVFEAKKAKVTDKDNDSEDDSGETIDPVDKGELKGKHKHRDDKDIDNDGDVDSSDKFLHKKRKAISKAIKKDKVDESPLMQMQMDREHRAKKIKAERERERAGSSNSTPNSTSDKKNAKERKLKAIADKRKSLSREKETAERDAA